MIDYELAKEIGATHYHNRTGEMYKVDLGALLVFRRDSWVHSGLPLGEAASKVKPIPPKRTRTEYEKVTESIWDLRDEFERGELYFKCSEGDWVQAVHESEVVHFLNDCGLYRKVEKEIDWREEVMKYLFENDYHNSRIETNDWIAIKQSFKNDEFLEMCRVALRANREIE